MRRHDCVKFEAAVGFNVRLQRLEAALIDRNRHMRVSLSPTVSGKMFAAGTHAHTVQAINECTGELRDDFRVAVKGTTADDAAVSPVEIEHGRKREIDATGQQFGREYEADVVRCLNRLRLVAFPQFAERAHRRQAGETLPAALYPAPFMVNGDEQWRRA